MPAELILGHSPPVYSPLLYRPLVVTAPSIASRSVPPRIRPCLSTGSLPLDSLRNNDGTGKQKKRVVFADDRGRPLTQVRVMSEPSNVPPLWSTAYLAGVTGGVLRTKMENEEAQEGATPWQVTFPQPASDYLAFRRKLDQENVSLENVIVRESEQCLVGTVKVRNLAYDKEVVVRASSDAWKTHEDVHCTYVEQPGAPALVLYDTFRFRLTVPVKSNSIEFCVRFRTDGKEYWDNNEGKNYVVRKKQEPRAPAKRYDILTAACEGLSSSGARDGIPRITDATRANMRVWSEFAPWQHLANDAPYWGRGRPKGSRAEEGAAARGRGARRGSRRHPPARPIGGGVTPRAAQAARKEPSSQRFHDDKAREPASGVRQDDRVYQDLPPVSSPPLVSHRRPGQRRAPSPRPLSSSSLPSSFQELGLQSRRCSSR
ncbi:hypothetical protein KM043_003252 [Ampulex compressa]|nr:hypothetical protein KM043_003252 [Ampulex compressa]